jgi:predicted MPP superfamily phosphohydrolase
MEWLTPARALGAGAAVGLGLLAYASLIERNAFTLRRVTVPVLDPGSSDITVLHLSDLHLAPWQKSKRAWVRSLAELKPDLVVNTGDNLGHPDALAALRGAFAGFSGTPGVFVNGSNDYFAPEIKNPLRYLAGPSVQRREPRRLNTAALERYLTDDLGWVNLNNTAARLNVDGRDFEFFGVDDPHRRFDQLDDMSIDLDELREGDPSRAAVSIGVAHAPYQRILNAFILNGAEVIFAGHTHGGQVCVPGVGALVTNCDLPRSMAKGLSTWTTGARTAFLHVSAGLGTSIYAPVRFACRPEATLVTLTASTVVTGA